VLRFAPYRDSLQRMSVRRRKWTTKSGEPREAWVVAYTDATGKRHIETFERKKDADNRQAAVKTAIAAGIHVPTNKSATITQAARDWLVYIEGEGIEPTTLRNYSHYIRGHLLPRIGNVKLAALTAPRVHLFRDELVRDLSRITAQKVLITLKAILKDARRRGNLAGNPAEGVSIKADKRAAAKLQIGVDIPSREEIARIIAAAKGRARPFLVTAIFTGMRSSELRGLRWSDVDMEKGELHVRQRADRLNRIGNPKSASSRRTIPIGPMVVNTLREWKLACPKGSLDLVFPSHRGGIQHHGNIFMRQLRPVLKAAGIGAKYGLHSFRHFFASWCANRKVDGGRELPIKMVQELLGHSSILMTADVYGHLFPRAGDTAELAAAELSLVLGQKGV
jgi:integrase